MDNSGAPLTERDEANAGLNASQQLSTEQANLSVVQRPIDTLRTEEVEGRVEDAVMEPGEDQNASILGSFGKKERGNLDEDDDNVW